MAATLTSLNAALKRVWTQDTLEEQLYQKTPFLDRIEKRRKYTVGETARVPLHVSRNGGYTALPSGGGTLNTAGNQGLQKAEFNYTNHHQQVAIQGDALDGTASSTNAIVSAADLEIKGALNDIRRQLTRQLFMNGDALIARCRTSATNNVDLDTTSGAHATSRGWLFTNQPVDVGTTANEVALVDNSLITAVDATTTAPNVTVAAGNQTGEGTTHYVSQANSRSGATSYEMNGLQNIVIGTATLGGLAPATEGSWASTVDATSQALTVSLLMQARQTVVQKLGNEPSFILTGLKQERKLYEQLQQQVRYTGDNISVGDQNKVKIWGNTEIWADPDCQDTDLYLGNFEHLFLVALDKPYWQNKISGGDILAWIQGTDSYGAKLSYRVNLAANNRSSLFRFSGLT